MNFSEEEIRKLLFCAADVLRRRQGQVWPGPQPWLVNLVRRLELAVAVSESGHESGCCETQLDVQWISAREAAPIVGLSKRHTQRLAADLDGRLVDGRWMFRRSTVTSYAEGRSA